MRIWRTQFKNQKPKYANTSVWNNNSKYTWMTYRKKYNN